MVTTVNTGARLDRLPISSFHYRIFWLIAAGMFFDGYNLYVAGPVLGAAIQSKFSTLSQNGWFLSLTLSRDDPRLAACWLLGRSLRPPLHIPIQPDDIRSRLPRRGLRS